MFQMPHSWQAKLAEHIDMYIHTYIHTVSWMVGHHIHLMITELIDRGMILFSYSQSRSDKCSIFIGVRESVIFSDQAR